LVGSGAGAVIRRKLLGCIRRFRLRARLGVAVIPFPAPATSHAAGRFTALRAPAHFTARFMRPKSGPSSGRIVGASGPADWWVLLSIHPRLPYQLRHRVQQGPFALRTLLRFIYEPSRNRFAFSRLRGGYRWYGRSCSIDFAMGRGRFLQLLGLPLSSCRLYQTAGV